MKKGHLPFAPLSAMTGRYFIVQSQKPMRVVNALRKRFRDMRFTPQPGSFKVLATYKQGSEGVSDARAQEIQNFIERIQEE